MMSKITNRCAAAITTLLMYWLSTSAKAAAPGEGIALNTLTGDYTIDYCDPDQPPTSACILEQVVYSPATKIDPKVKSLFVIRDASWAIAYRYLVRNGLAARQPLIQFVLDPVSDILSPLPLSKTSSPTTEPALTAEINAGLTAINSPLGWSATSIASNVHAGLRIGWGFVNLPDVNAGLQKASARGGFGFSSMDLPGIVPAQLAGNAPLTSFDDDGPTGDIGSQFNQLSTHDYVSRFAAVPAITVPTPLDRAETVRRIDAELGTWVGYQLVDATVFQQIDGMLQSAINAAAHNDQVAFLATIGQVRNTIRNIYVTLDESETDWTDKPASPLISRLAARVLLFDLLFVTTHP